MKGGERKWQNQRKEEVAVAEAKGEALTAPDPPTVRLLEVGATPTIPAQRKNRLAEVGATSPKAGSHY